MPPHGAEKVFFSSSMSPPHGTERVVFDHFSWWFHGAETVRKDRQKLEFCREVIPCENWKRKIKRQQVLLGNVRKRIVYTRKASKIGYFFQVTKGNIGQTVMAGITSMPTMLSKKCFLAFLRGVPEILGELRTQEQTDKIQRRIHGQNGQYQTFSRLESPLMSENLKSES